MSTTAEEQGLATEILAQNALKHPLWQFDAHVAALTDAGFDESLISKLGRAIDEAIHYSQALILKEAEGDGWHRFLSSSTNTTLWEDPDTGLYWETESLIKEYLDRADAS